MMMATSGLDAMAPGAGTAAKIGIQLANRTIGYMGQVAGIGASGLLETLSVGDNPMGSFGKLADIWRLYRFATRVYEPCVRLVDLPAPSIGA